MRVLYSSLRYKRIINIKMELFEDRENWEIFHKDSRNPKASGRDGRRQNVKENRKRLQRMQERQQQGESEKIVVDESTDEEPDLGKKKYDNGKPKRGLKIQLTYEQEEQMEKLPKQRGKKQ